MFHANFSVCIAKSKILNKFSFDFPLLVSPLSVSHRLKIHERPVSSNIEIVEQSFCPNKQGDQMYYTNIKSQFFIHKYPWHDYDLVADAAIWSTFVESTGLLGNGKWQLRSKLLSFECFGNVKTTFQQQHKRIQKGFVQKQLEES